MGRAGLQEVAQTRLEHVEPCVIWKNGAIFTINLYDHDMGYIEDGVVP